MDGSDEDDIFSLAWNMCKSERIPVLQNKVVNSSLHGAKIAKQQPLEIMKQHDNNVSFLNKEDDNDEFLHESHRQLAMLLEDFCADSDSKHEACKSDEKTQMFTAKTKNQHENDYNRDLGPLIMLNQELEEVLDKENEENANQSAFQEYIPCKLKFGKPHPDSVVETKSLSGVIPPDITYNLHFDQELIDSGKLSSLQLETIVYACQKHEKILQNNTRAGFFIGDGPGVGKGRIIAGIVLENQYCGRKKSLWISVSNDLKFDAIRDLEDVGCHISVQSLNKFRYGEEIADFGSFATEGVVFSTYSSLIGESHQESRMTSRLEQLYSWLGPDFDGLIVFDECHKAKNLLPGPTSKPSKTAITVMNLQERLPNARFIYCSATGATEPRNLAYMDRLGIWGKGTPFNDFKSFLLAIEKRGVGAMEIIAMDMKLRGSYLARQLSFMNATFEVVEVDLTASFVETYNKSVDLWTKTKQCFDKCSDILDYSSRQKCMLMAQFWSFHQRFFKYMCIAAKIDTVVMIALQALKEKKCVVIGLQSTGESRLKNLETSTFKEIPSTCAFVFESLIKNHFPKDMNFDSALSSQKINSNLVDDAVDEFDEYENMDEKFDEIQDDDQFDGVNLFDIVGTTSTYEIEPINNDALLSVGVNTKRYVWQDEKFENVSSKRIKFHSSTKDSKVGQNLTSPLVKVRAILEDLLSDYKKLADKLPPNSLDHLINSLGGSHMVSELTGRKCRIVKNFRNLFEIQSRAQDDTSLEMVNISEKDSFMDGEKLIAIISEAASAGISLQADRRVINQRRRLHITLELPWNADRAIQQFGRTHRSNQSSSPEYLFLISKLAGEKRFASVVARRLESLGALTHGDRRASETQDLSQFNYENKYGRTALLQLIQNIVSLNESKGKNFIAVPPFPSDYTGDFQGDMRNALESSGILNLKNISNPLVSNSSSELMHNNNNNKESCSISRFFNRLLGLHVDVQNSLFSYFTDILSQNIRDAKRHGLWDSGILDYGSSGEEIDLISKKKFDVLSSSGIVSVFLMGFSIERGISWEKALKILGSTSHPEEGFYLMRKTSSYKRQPAILVTYSNLQAFLLNSKKNIDSKDLVGNPEKTTSIKNLFVFRPNVGCTGRMESIENILKKYHMVTQEEAHHPWKEQYEISKDQCSHIYWWNKCTFSLKKKANNSSESSSSLETCLYPDSMLPYEPLCEQGKRTKVLYLISGALFAIWDRLESVFADNPMRIARVSIPKSDQKHAGIVLPSSLVNQLLHSLEKKD